MDQNLAIFENEHFGSVRVIMKEGELWFVAKDVCDCLGIGNSRQAVSYLDNDEKGVISNDTPGGTQQLSVISESGLYSCVLRSRKPEAKQFKRWVTHEVLPAIRKTGNYSIQSIDNVGLANAIEQMNNKLDALGEQIQELKPKAKFYDAIAETDHTYDMNEAAKSIKKCGRNQLFKTLKDKKVLMKNRLPYQKYINNGLFQVVVDKNSFYTKTVATGKGLEYIHDLLEEE